MKTKLQILVAGVLLATLGTGLGQPCITITTEPQGQTNCLGTTVTFSVVATGAEPLRYQWQQAFDYLNYVDRLDETNSTLLITNAQNNTLVVLQDGPTPAYVTTVGVGTRPQGVDVNPSTQKVYVGNTGSNNVTVLSTNSPFGVITTIPLAP